MSLPRDQALNRQRTYANGVVVTVTGVRFFTDRIEVGVDIQNGRDGRAVLEGAMGSQLRLEDATDTTYDLSRSEQGLLDPSLTLEEGQRVQGALVFLGRLEPGAGELRLLSWDGDDGSVGHGPGPRTAVDVDLPVRWGSPPAGSALSRTPSSGGRGVARVSSLTIGEVTRSRLRDAVGEVSDAQRGQQLRRA